MSSGRFRPSPLHLAAHVDHLLERGRDEAGEADHVRLALARRLQDLVGGHHHPEVDHLVVVAAQHHAHDVLADVVDVALDRGHHDPALGPPRARHLLRLQERLQVGHRLLHDAGALDHLGQEHAARPEQLPHHVHAVHERALDHGQGPAELLSRLLRVGLDVVHDALDQRVGEALLDRAPPPGVLLHRGLALLLDGIGEGQQTLGGVGAAVQQHVLHQLEQVLGDLLVDLELAGVHDPHVHAGADGVVQEGRVHGLPHRLVAAEGEGDVADPAAHLAQGQLGLDPPRGLDEGHRVVVVLLDPGGHGQDVGVEDDVLGREPHLLGQDAVGARADLDLAVHGGGLAGLVEGHHHHPRPVPLYEAGLALEGLLPLLEADGVDDALALDALQARPRCTLHLELSIITGTRAMSGSAATRFRKVVMAPLGVQHPLVHVHVDDLGPALDLVPGHGQGLLVLSGQDEPRELRGAGDVGALADVDEVGVGPDGERLQAAEARVGLGRGGLVRLQARARPPRWRAMCAGVVPQQPPTTFSQPLAAKPWRSAAMISGVSSKPPKALGRPALG